MKIKFLGAVENAGDVTGSRTLLTLPDGMEILVDFGIIQSNLGNLGETMAWNGRDFEFDVEEVDYVIITHAHADHSALLPLLIKRGFKGKVISTAATADFCRVSFPDSAKIMQSDCDWANRRRSKNKLEPLYSKAEAIEATKWMRGYDFNTEIVLSENTTLELLSAGHMLGACMPKITHGHGKRQRTILFTGDTSAKNSSHPFLRVADDIGEVDYIVTESTYGNRVHEREDPVLKLHDAVRETCLDNGKTLVIPVFSLQRSSEILWHLREAFLLDTDLHNNIPVYLDTPMGIEGQRVMDKNREYWGEKWLSRDRTLTSIFDWEPLQYINTYSHSQSLNNKNPKVILSSGGMAQGGRVLDHLRSFLPVRGCKVLFCGYQAEHSLGRRLLEGETKSVAIDRNQVTIRADIDNFTMSSHADVNELTDFLKTSKKGKLKRILVNHGDEDAIDAMARELKQHFKTVSVVKPRYNKTIKL